MNQQLFDAIWVRFTRAIAFVAGTGIMVYETIADHSDRPWLYAAAVGMMGLPIARAADVVLSRIGGTGPQETPAAKSVEETADDKTKK